MIGKSQWWKNLENSETNSPIDYPSAAEKVEGVVMVVAVVGGWGWFIQSQEVIINRK